MSISRSGICYLTHVWNPVVGCTRGCPECWARRFYATRGQGFGCWLCREFVPHVHPERLMVPGGTPKVIGVGFMTDLCETGRRLLLDGKGTERGNLMDGYCNTADVWRWLAEEVMRHPEHVFVTVTKEPARLPAPLDLPCGYPDNWWIGATCRDQAEVDRNVPALLRSGVKHPFLNLEPLCGAVDIPLEALGYMANAEGQVYYAPTIEACIVGGMSKQGRDHQPAPLHPDWVRSVRDQCQAAGVPFYFKQWDGPKVNWPRYGGRRDGGPPTGIDGEPILDDHTHRELPGRWGEILAEREQGSGPGSVN